MTVTLSTADGTATAGEDYAATVATVTFADGDDADKTKDITIVADGTPEADESFTVTLSNPTGGAVIGSVGAAIITVGNDDGITGPEIAVLDDLLSNVPDTGTLAFGTTAVGTPVAKVVTVRNIGSANLVLSPINAGSLPQGFSLVSNFGATTLAPGTSTTFTVRLDATSEGNYSGPVSFSDNDSDENPFDLLLLGTVASVTVEPVPGLSLVGLLALGLAMIAVVTRRVRRTEKLV